MSKRCALVTGGAGFVGSHVVDALMVEGWDVVAVDDLSTGDARRVASEAALEVVDITDRGALEKVFEAVRPAAVFISRRSRASPALLPTRNGTAISTCAER